MEQEQNKAPQIVIGIPCNKDQTHQVWSRYMGLQVPFERVWWTTRGGALTDKNRNEIARYFLGSGAEWLLFLDDDVEPKPDTLLRLLSHEKELVSGIYYRRTPPCDPLVYTQDESGWYRPVIEWEEGSLFQVPNGATGLGCTLINRSVFQKIMAHHTLYMRANGSLGLAYLGDVYTTRGWAKPGLRLNKKGKKAELIQQVWPLRYEDLADNQQIPFFAFEFGRTEDLYFFELARAAGVECWVDSSIELQHWGYNHVGRQQFEQVKKWMAAQIEAQDVAGEGVEFQETRTDGTYPPEGD